MRISLRGKLMGSFCIVLILMIAVSYLGISGSSKLQQNYDEIVKVDMPINEAVWNVKSNNMEKVATIRAFMVYKTITYAQSFEELLKKEDSNIKQLEKMLKDDQSKELLTKIKSGNAAYNDYCRQIIEAVKANDMNEAFRLAVPAKEALAGSTSAMNEWQALLDKHEAEYIKAAEAASKSQAVMTYAVSIVAVVISLCLGLLITSGITKPVNQMVVLLREMAESGGDLTKRIQVKAKDEIGDLATWFNAFLDKLHDIISQIKQSSQMVATAANETSLGNQDLSQRTEEQASSLEEISSTIEEVSASLQKSSGSSGQADSSSRATLQIVHKGETVVNDLHQAMEEITKGSHEIAEIIAKVNDIAFQTNLLALNAAVEAARAGEQGRGFAVVAAEVRNLAGRTAESAKEIEGLIKESIKKVERGNGLMQETASVLNEIVDNIQRTTDVISEIASSMREQSAAADDIRTAVEQLNQVTQQNASLVEEIAGSSESVSNEAGEMTTLVGRFKLNETINSGGQIRRATGSFSANGSKQSKPARQMNTNKPSVRQQADFDEGDFEKF